MINEITLATVAGAGLGTLARVIHPTRAQANATKQAADAYHRTYLTPLVRTMLWRIAGCGRAWLRSVTAGRICGSRVFPETTTSNVAAL